MPLTAGVAVSGASMTYDKLYTYKVPAAMRGHIFVGSMVLVPFGRGATRPRTGVVIQLDEDGKTNKRTKPIAAVAPDDARLTGELLKIVQYLKEYTFCTWYDAVRAVIPYGAQYKPVKLDEGWVLQKALRRHTEVAYTKTSPPPAEAARPSAKGQAVLDFIGGETKSRAEIMAACGVGRGVADTLVKQGYLTAAERDITLDVTGALALEAGAAALPATPGPSTGPEGVHGPRGSAEEPHAKHTPGEIPPLTDAQNEVAGPLLQRMANAGKETPPRPNASAPRPALLYGITGSGKTAVFLNLIHAALQAGKTALVLVPEIGLTPQMVTALTTAFGSRVAVQHSALSNTERLLQWRQIQRGEASVVVGTRSAVFAPLENIGIIVVDEEQERTYQSESTPRYDALEIARRRAVHHGALLLMASATPSVADYYAAQQGRFELFQLTERFAGLPLPKVDIVDMRGELSGGGAISVPLAEGIQKNIAAGAQTILLLNRRGYNRVGVCRDCGEALKCGTTENLEAGNNVNPLHGREAAYRSRPASQDVSGTPGVICSAGEELPAEPNAGAKRPGCSVPMVYHKAGNRLMCHYCGHTVSPPPEKCPACGGDIRYTGFGTQRLEEELEAKFPTARVLRMDLDTTGKKGAHGEMLARFAAGEYDILLGTQMVAKGLDFERVSLVGVIGIDSLLFSQGYRAYENVFSLVTQVVGRSGRAGAPGRAIIQTMDPENPVLNLAAAQDYDAFYRQEIAFRKLALYPPFCTVCAVAFVAGEEALALRAAHSFSRILQHHARQRPDIPLRILGPAPMNVAQVAGSYRYRLILKCRGDAAFRALAMAALEDYNKDGWMRTVPVALDFHSEGAL